MKTLTVILGLLLVTLTVIAQNPQCKGKRYDKKLKDSVQCMSPFVLPSGYCRFHDPNTLRCGADKAKGGKCQQIVAKPGERCRFHQDRKA